MGQIPIRKTATKKKDFRTLIFNINSIKHWILDACKAYRVSQQVWDMLNVMFQSSEKFASEASYVYKILTQ